MSKVFIIVFGVPVLGTVATYTICNRLTITELAQCNSKINDDQFKVSGKLADFASVNVAESISPFS